MSEFASHFNVYDLVGHLVPGTAALGIALPVIPVDTLTDLAGRAQFVTGVFGLLLVYTLGMLISAAAALLDRIHGRVFGNPGAKSIEDSPWAEIADEQLKTYCGATKVVLSSKQKFEMMWVVVTEFSSTDRPQRLYALSMLFRSLSLILAAALIGYGLAAFRQPEERHLGALAMVFGVLSVGCFVRYRQYVKYYCRDVLTRFVALKGELKGGAV